MNRSYLGGFLVKFWPTKVTLVTMRFHCFCFLLPVRRTLNISSSATGLTCISHPVSPLLAAKQDRPVKADYCKKHSDLWEWDLPLASLLSSLLLYGVAEDLGTVHLQQQVTSAVSSCSP